MDRDEVAIVLGISPEDVRIVPTACGGGFGGKLDAGMQPLLGVAAWLTGKTVACVYTRPESMAASTKRHPAHITARLGCDEEGRLQALDFTADFNTGAYASWGPTVAGRVPVHASGPYKVPHVSARGRAVFTNNPPSGAFRGFGVPQGAIAGEILMDDLAAQMGMDRLEFRLLNSLRPGDTTPTGQTLDHSVGMAACLEALKPGWRELHAQSDTHNHTTSGKTRRGVGVGCMWYGIGNTGLSNPSTMRVVLHPDGAITFFNGVADIGQGSNTIMAQICADALGAPVGLIRQVTGDTDRTADAGKTSASRQTFVSGKATELAAADLRAQILRLANAGEGARIHFGGSELEIHDGGQVHRVDLAKLPVEEGDNAVLTGHGTFDPPTSVLDEKGQGVPYATYGFAAQVAQVEVDVELGTVKVLKMIAAHDVGRAINPIQVEGQIHGGIAQGLGLALMEEYHSGVTDNLHDYLIPTAGDMPEIDVLLIEDAEPLGPYGAKGVGEPGLVPTAPAILGAIRHATGVRITDVPATPHRVRAALLAAKTKKPSEGRDGP
jgi:CO/xanthine dehydrogenase Mo-binding subunit